MTKCSNSFSGSGEGARGNESKYKEENTKMNIRVEREGAAGGQRGGLAGESRPKTEAAATYRIQYVIFHCRFCHSFYWPFVNFNVVVVVV